MNDKTLPIGSWSHGTLRSEDLAETLILMANSVGIESESGIIISGGTAFDDLARYLDRHMDCDVDACDGDTYGLHYRQCPTAHIDETISDAIDALNEYAPIYCYVGMHPGDGSDLGVWLSSDALDEAIRCGTRINSETVENADDGVRIHISDHGNVEVYALDGSGSLLAIV